MTRIFNIVKRGHYLTTSLVLVGALLIASHLYVNNRGVSYQGFFLIADHLYNLLLVVSLILICTFLGFHFLSSWRNLFAAPLERLLFSLALGIGFLSVIILFMGFFSLLMPPVIGAVFVALVCLTRKSIKEVFILIRNAGAYIKDTCNTFSLIFFGVICLFLLVLASAPPIDWDTLTYHVQGPALFLQAHRIFLPSDNLNIFGVQLIHMLYIPLLAFGNASAPGILSAFLGLLLGLAIFEFGNRFFNSIVASYSLSFFWASTVILIVLITPRIDVTVALFCFLAHYLLIKSNMNSPGLKELCLSAILLGFGFGVKYNAGLYVLALSPLILWIAYHNSSTHIKLAKTLLIFSFLFCCAASPWLLKNWILLKSPVYPFLTGRQYPAWISSLVSPGVVVDPQIYQVGLQIPAFFNWEDFFFHPARLAMEPEGFFYFANLIFLLLPLAVFCLNNSVVFWLALPSLLFVFVLNLFWPHSNLRYLIPAIPPLTITVVFAVWKAGSRYLNAKLNKNLLNILSYFILLPNVAMVMLFWPANFPALKYFIGISSQKSFFNKSPYTDMASYINSNLSQNDKVMLVNEGRGYYFKIPVIQDPDGINWTLLSQNMPDPEAMQAAGITHILTNFYNLNYLVERGIDPKSFHWDKFLLFADRYLQPIYSNEAYVLYRIKDKGNSVNPR